MSPWALEELKIELPLSFPVFGVVCGLGFFFVTFHLVSVCTGLSGFWWFPLILLNHRITFVVLNTVAPSNPCLLRMMWRSILVYGKLQKTWTPWLFNSCRVMTGYASRLQVREIIFCSNISFLCNSIILFLFFFLSLQGKYCDIRHFGSGCSFPASIYGTKKMRCIFFFNHIAILFANQNHFVEVTAESIKCKRKKSMFF